MSAVIAIVLMLVLVVALIGFCIVNAVRITRHMTMMKSVDAFRTRLEHDANAVLDGLLNRPDDRSASGSQ